MAPRRRVLLYSLMPTQWKTMHQVARVLASSDRYEPVVFFDRNENNAPYERDVRACLAAGIRCLDDEGPLTEDRLGALAPRPAPPRSVAVHGLHFVVGRSKRFWEEVVEPVLAFPESYRRLRDRLAFARAVMKRERIALLVLPGDSVSYETPAWIAAAHSLGIEAVIVPFSTNTPDGAAADFALLSEQSAERWYNRVLAAFAPKWVYSHRGRRLVRTPAGTALALHALRLDPPKPWVLHSGAADLVIAETARVRDDLVAQGLPAERTAVVGALADDTLARSLPRAHELREQLYASLGLPPGRPMILGSICDYVRYFELGGPRDGLRTSRELIDLWVDTMAATGHDVVLSLHPWLRLSDWRYLERANVRIADRPIEELMPLCDFFVVSVSVTVRLAIACGKPVVNHDILQFRIGDYSDAGGVIVVESCADFRAAVSRLAADRAFHEATAVAQARAAPLYGALDGKVGERMLGLFDELSK